MLLISICDLSGPLWLFLFWLLPFLLGLLLGYLLWAKYKEQLQDCNDELTNSQTELANTRHLLEECEKLSGDLRNESLLLKAQVREMKAKGKGLDQVKSRPLGKSKAASSSSRSAVVSDATSAYSSIKEDNLQIIEGIGPKMESVLKDKGIGNWQQLAKQTQQELRDLLDSFGTRYRIIDPTSWPQQAKLAADSEWPSLVALQKSISGDGQTSDSKVEKMLVKLGLLKEYAQDDLKAIEGIGPKIEELLKKRGITSWELLSQATTGTLSAILAEAGDRFRLANPSTWPEQAALASQGKWKDLEALKDSLVGGRRK